MPLVSSSYSSSLLTHFPTNPAEKKLSSAVKMLGGQGKMKQQASEAFYVYSETDHLPTKKQTPLPPLPPPNKPRHQLKLTSYVNTLKKKTKA